MLKSRKVLYLNSTDTPHVLSSEISQAGWQVDIVSDIPCAHGLVDSGHHRVGLALFNRFDARLHHDIENLMESCPGMEWIALLDPGCLDSPEICKLIHETFYDYHTLPPDRGLLLNTLGHAWGMASLQRPAPPDTERGEHEMVGMSPVMQDLFRGIRKIAGVDAPVLITGESGTGKELAALAIHERSTRAKGPYVAVNCGALPANLIQSELFGHEKGAFTGAVSRKIGRIEAAAGGTIFLDEIGDLPLDLQVNLLRFLQEKTIERVGSHQRLVIDACVIAATHVNLEEAVAQGRFREDLYYRLNVLHLRIPPLRERNGDIEILARFFFDKFVRDKGRNVKGFSQQALRMLNNHDWPGNVRELINRIRRAMVMCEHSLITPADLGLEKRVYKRQLITLGEARALADRQAIQLSLRHSSNNVTLAARQLGVSRVTLYRLMERYGLA
jgi:DNA-binding NtrC family response regulator